MEIETIITITSLVFGFFLLFMTFLFIELKGKNKQQDEEKINLNTNIKKPIIKNKINITKNYKN